MTHKPRAGADLGLKTIPYKPFSSEEFFWELALEMMGLSKPTQTNPRRDCSNRLTRPQENQAQAIRDEPSQVDSKRDKTNQLDPSWDKPSQANLTSTSKFAHLSHV